MSNDRAMAVERALKILEAFSSGAVKLSLAELSEYTGFYKSTILRLTNSLMAYLYINRDEDGFFYLGPTLCQLGSLYQKNFDFGRIIEPSLKRLRDALNESASFYIREKNVRVCLYRISSKRTLRHEIEQGAILPLGKGASGKILLWDGKGIYPENDGYAISFGEREPDVAAIAVPVFDSNNTLKGALSVSGLITHFQDQAFVDKAVALIKEEALKIGNAVVG